MDFSIDRLTPSSYRIDFIRTRFLRIELIKFQSQIVQKLKVFSFFLSFFQSIRQLNWTIIFPLCHPHCKTAIIQILTNCLQCFYSEIVWKFYNNFENSIKKKRKCLEKIQIKLNATNAWDAKKKIVIFYRIIRIFPSFQFIPLDSILYKSSIHKTR